MPAWNKYINARSLSEALQSLAVSNGPALPIGGGTDLLLDIQQENHIPVDTLVDITAVPELNRLEIIDDRLFIGAGLSIRNITESKLVQKHATAVVEACSLIGGPQVRNTATLGGNVAHALPAADGMIALLAMDTQVEIASEDGSRTAPLASMFKGPGESTLDKNREILVGFYLPLRRSGQGSAFARVMRPQGVALPILNMAIWLQRLENMLEHIRIAIGPSGPIPIRAKAVEVVLAGKPLTQETIRAAMEAIHNTIPFRSSPRRASAEYRHHLSEVLLENVITTAWKRAGQGDIE